jgi:TonB family protein
MERLFLSLVVNASGKVETVKLVSSKPARIFNREASKAVRRWQFKPKTIDGVACLSERSINSGVCLQCLKSLS